ncbi:hypothetical protein Droror1_Dr00020254, partial [Drosera rotundifolia]
SLFLSAARQVCFSRHGSAARQVSSPRHMACCPACCRACCEAPHARPVGEVQSRPMCSLAHLAMGPSNLRMLLSPMKDRCSSVQWISSVPQLSVAARCETPFPDEVHWLVKVVRQDPCSAGE